jgi:hypothetical protein
MKIDEPVDHRYSGNDRGRRGGGESDRFASFASESPPEPLAAASFYGLAGEVVCLIEPSSEADPAAC